jgi:hypothetical protein
VLYEARPVGPTRAGLLAAVARWAVARSLRRRAREAARARGEFRALVQINLIR